MTVSVSDYTQMRNGKAVQVTGYEREEPELRDVPEYLRADIRPQLQQYRDFMKAVRDIPGATESEIEAYRLIYVLEGRNAGCATPAIEPVQRCFNAVALSASMRLVSPGRSRRRNLDNASTKRSRSSASEVASFSASTVFGPKWASSVITHRPMFRLHHLNHQWPTFLGAWAGRRAPRNVAGVALGPALTHRRGMRICFIGDSFVNGIGDDDCLGWTRRLCAAARRSGRDLTAYDLGIRGDTSAMVLARWRAEASARLPDGVDGRLVFSFGTNDCARGADGRARLPHADALRNAETILRAAKAWLPTLMIGPPPVGDDPGVDARIAALTRDLGDLCAGLDVPFLPVLDALGRDAAWATEAAANDGSHPNAGGYATLAVLVAAWEPWRQWMEPHSPSPPANWGRGSG